MWVKKVLAGKIHKNASQKGEGVTKLWGGRVRSGDEVKKRTWKKSSLGHEGA